MKNNVYQIYYSDETCEALDSGFLPLDNTGQRPDWREYWAIREFFIGNTANPVERYGFLSPKFGQKAQLTSAQVMEFMDSTPDDIDVVTFSPFYDMAAFCTNVFEHAAWAHPGILPAIEGAMELIAPGVDVNRLIMTSRQTVFCNYLIAKPTFWKQWLEMCDLIFKVAESGTGRLAGLLNANVQYAGQLAPAKVFIIERIASLILSTQPAWSIRNFNSMTLPASASPLSRFGADLLALDGLKYAAAQTGISEYMTVFHQLREGLKDRAFK
ncbi:hypothetical protein P3T24_003414 [Paraburkholderia sp. GAS33]|uniref:hypothetical protein n=1 Tax=Paraburkholderia sp. GAS33 TaxID=3035130 RepID=UPI003D216816